jgi:magnesium-transporting ATPase (P-type)
MVPPSRHRVAAQASGASFIVHQPLAPRAGLQLQAARRLVQYGANALREKHVSVLRRLLSYFWGPIPWMIEAAALLSALVRHWPDLVIIFTLLLVNAAVGFWQEFKADNAIALLKQKLALRARVLRDGRWQEVAAAKLVPGDVVLVKLGNVIPADVRLFEGEYLSVDQSALTGESLPVDKAPGDVAYAGSIARRGEMKALVTATGMGTYFGKTAQLVQAASTTSHFQRAVLRIGNFLILVTLGLVALMLVVALVRAAALASEAGGGDPIDAAVLEGVRDHAALEGARILRFHPFDPVTKLTQAEVEERGVRFKVAKGAPQVILEMAKPDEALRRQVKEQVDAFAARGYRTLGVARAEADGPWGFLGLLPLSDPPREDSAHTIDECRRMGIAVKMVTGDHLAIARQIAAELHLGPSILPADAVFGKTAGAGAEDQAGAHDRVAARLPGGRRGVRLARATDRLAARVARLGLRPRLVPGKQPGQGDGLRPHGAPVGSPGAAPRSRGAADRLRQESCAGQWSADPVDWPQGDGCLRQGLDARAHLGRVHRGRMAGFRPGRTPGSGGRAGRPSSTRLRSRASESPRRRNRLRRSLP